MSGRLEGEGLMELARAFGHAEELLFASGVVLEAAVDDRVDAWLDGGMAGEMGYMVAHREARRDPAREFTPYRSALVFVMPYDGAAAPDPSPMVGNIARYALGDDYHEVMKSRLFRIADRLRAADPSLSLRCCVDTAPVNEKTVAERAGIGWRGKHTNIIRQGFGSWFFLGEILVDRDVPESMPAKDRCGRCTACIDVCPTRAIVAPYVLDARRCISYLTIELRGPIPREFRAAIGHRIFGCDDCQEVCPWNRFAADAPIKEMRARPGLRNRTLVEWFALDEAGFREVFRHSAVKRCKYSGFRRNVAVALGNAGDEASATALLDAVDDPSPLVRGHVAWALAHVGHRVEEARVRLTERHAVEDDAFAKDEVTAALADLEKR